MSQSEHYFTPFNDRCDITAFYEAHDFLAAPLRLYMKVSTARKALTTYDAD